MSSTVFDFAIVGAGAAGLQLALAMKADPFFHNKKIVILDKSAKDVNDKTWCFWERGAGLYDSVITHSWDTANFVNKERQVRLDLGPYRYKMLRSADFYDYARREMEGAHNIRWVHDEIVDVKENRYAEMQGIQGNYSSKHLFDSRIPPEFGNQTDSSTRLLQHFKGWFIETETDVFDSSQFLMMDFRLQWKDTTSFTYVLPTSSRTALVEFTLFTTELIESSEYDSMLAQYIREKLKLDRYSIAEVETGVIPMSDYPFHKHHSESVTKIGTAGGWVKPSSGYSFKNSDRFSKKIVENIKTGIAPSAGIARGRFRMYDALFLDVLRSRNEMGPSVFASLYTRNSPQKILKFLDEETSLWEDFSIVKSFDQLLFLRTLFQRLKNPVADPRR